MSWQMKARSSSYSVSRYLSCCYKTGLAQHGAENERIERKHHQKRRAHDGPGVPMAGQTHHVNNSRMDCIRDAELQSLVGRERPAVRSHQHPPTNNNSQSTQPLGCVSTTPAMCYLLGVSDGVTCQEPSRVLDDQCLGR